MDVTTALSNSEAPYRMYQIVLEAMQPGEGGSIERGEAGMLCKELNQEVEKWETDRSGTQIPIHLDGLLCKHPLGEWGLCRKRNVTGDAICSSPSQCSG